MSGVDGSSEEDANVGSGEVLSWMQEGGVDLGRGGRHRRRIGLDGLLQLFLVLRGLQFELVFLGLQVRFEPLIDDSVDVVDGVRLVITELFDVRRHFFDFGVGQFQA